MRELLKEFTQYSSNGQQNEEQSILYSHLSDILLQVRQISYQLKQRLKQCSLYNNSMYPPCIPANSILDLL